MDSAILKENWSIVEMLSKAGGEQREPFYRQNIEIGVLPEKE